MIEWLGLAGFSVPAVLFIAAVILFVAVGLMRSRRRGAGIRSFGIGVGLLYEGRRADLRQTLAELPCMQHKGRHVFSHVLSSPDEVMADWRVHRPAGKRRRQVIQTIFAFRSGGENRAATRTEHEDPHPDGFGTVVVEAAGEWVACYVVGRRIPADQLASFRERSRVWAAEALV